MQKKRIFSSVILVIVSIYFTGCAAMQTKESPREPQEIVVKVEAINPTKITVEDKVRIVKSMSVANPEIRLSGLSSTSGDRAYMSIFSGLRIADVKNIYNDINYLNDKTKIKDIQLFVNSPGGDAFSGLALADQIERARRLGFKITAHGSGIIASAAVPVFISCDYRFAAPGTLLMVHEPALWKNKVRETASDIESQNDLLKRIQKRYREKMDQYTKLDETKWEELEKKTTWFDVDTAIRWGLVDEKEY